MAGVELDDGGGVTLIDDEVVNTIVGAVQAGGDVDDAGEDADMEEDVDAYAGFVMLDTLGGMLVEGRRRMTLFTVT